MIYQASAHKLLFLDPREVLGHARKILLMPSLRMNLMMFQNIYFGRKNCSYNYSFDSRHFLN